MTHSCREEFPVSFLCSTQRTLWAFETLTGGAPFKMEIKPDHREHRVTRGRHRGCSQASLIAHCSLLTAAPAQRTCRNFLPSVPRFLRLKLHATLLCDE